MAHCDTCGNGVELSGIAAELAEFGEIECVDCKQGETNEDKTSEDWTEKYRPDTVKEIVGNQKTIQEFVEWFETWDEHQTPAVLHGPPGVGKTALAHAIGEENDYQVNEVNASDKRNKSEVEESVVNTCQSAPVGAPGRLVIVDEADNLSRGGKRKMTEAVKEATQPLVLLANYYFDGLSNAQRENTKEFEFEYVKEGEIGRRLMMICQEEDIEIPPNVIKEITKSNDGDVRGAVRDLESAATGRTAVTKGKIAKYYDMGDSFLIAGPENISDEKSNQIFESVKDKIRADTWVIRGQTKFDISAGEYALDNGIDLDIILPKRLEVLVKDWSEIKKMRLESLIEQSGGYSHIFEDEEEIDVEEYASWLIDSGFVEQVFLKNPMDDDCETISDVSTVPTELIGTGGTLEIKT